MLRYLIFLLAFVVYIQPVQAQDEGTVVPPEEVDGDIDEIEEAEEIEEEIEIEPLTPMQFSEVPSYEITKVDSLLRWELWSNAAEWRHYQTGNITYRLGGFGRNDGTILRGHEDRHQKVYHEGILLNDRVSGSVNSNRMPHHRFSRVFERRHSTRHETEYQNRRFYVTEPLTMINYDQGQYNYRSTEGFFTRNIGRKTNIELSYWGKNDDGDYSNSEFSGRIASGRAFHHINENLIAEGGMFYNGLQLDEPNGYQIPDMNTYGFLPFNASPVEAQDRSSISNNLIYSSLWRRPDEHSDINSQVSAYQNNYRRFYFGSADSTFYKVSTRGLQGRHWMERGPLALRLSLNADYSNVDEDTNQSLDRTSWMSYTGRAEGDFDLLDAFKVSGWSDYTARTDGFREYDLGAKVSTELPFGLSAYGSYALGEQMPTIQQLYWESGAYQGNPDLSNELITRMEAGASIQPFQTMQLGARVYRKNISDPIMMGIDTDLMAFDSTFTQSRGYSSEGAEMFASVDASRFEGEVSVTYQQFSSDSPLAADQQLAQSGSRAWARASAFYKNYIFDSAAFVKAGGRFLFSPNPYRSGTYIPQLDYWESNSVDQGIPQFHRFDLEVSARVRSVMVHMRLENVLNQVTQLGYFETANNPMPGRVFRVGVKWVFRN
ncbi:MAG: putative porin [Balneolales bacterium]